MAKKTKTKFDRVYFQNRWKERKYLRPCDWVILGLSIWWAGPNDYCYKLSFFGLELKFWFNREFL